MKKGLTLALGTAFLLGSAASALATHEGVPQDTSVVAASNAQITLDGALRMRGQIDKSTAKDSAANKYYDGRARLGVKATSGPASGYLQLESDIGETSDTYTWGAEAAEFHNGGGKQGGMSILQAWINYKPGMFGVKVGHMPLALGNKLFFDHGYGDDAIVAYMSNDTTDAGALIIKFDEGSLASTVDPADTTDSKANSNGEIDGYVVYMVQKMNNMKIGADVTWIHGGSLDLLDLYNVGVNFAGNFGPAKVKADVEYQMGDSGGFYNIFLHDLTDKGTSTNQSDISAYAAMVDATVAAGPANVGLTVGYGSGDDDANDNDVNTFATGLTDTRYFTTIIGYRQPVPYLAGGTNGTAYTLNGVKHTGLSNLLLVQAHADMKTTCPLTGKDLALDARLSYAKLNEVPTGADDSLGTEIDLNATWTLTPGLSYKVELAYLVADDAWKTGPTDDPDDAYFLRHGLELKF